MDREAETRSMSKTRPISRHLDRTGLVRKDLENMGAFHYAKLTGQRSVGIPEENGTTFSDKTGPTNRKLLLSFQILLPDSLIRAKNRFVKNGTANFGRPKYVDHLQR